MSRSLARLIYRSRRPASPEATRVAELRDILATARAHNDREGLSGVLMHDENWFIQILEGEPAALRDLYERICLLYTSRRG